MSSQESRRDFLVEIGTEELPPRALLRLSETFAEQLAAQLRAARLAFKERPQSFATPRRLAVRVAALAERQPEAVRRRVGPAVAGAFQDDGSPTRAAEGFARSCGVAVASLEQEEINGVLKLTHTVTEPGQQTIDLLPGFVRKALAELPIPKPMRAGASAIAFARPVHWVVMLYGEDVVPGTVLGKESARTTRGHRHHCNKALSLAHPGEYESVLGQGLVIADFAMRRDTIRWEVEKRADERDAAAVIDDGLLDEVTALTEWPVAMVGEFDEAFLELPPEVLTLTLKTHQKCFCLTDSEGNLLPAFVFVSNIKSREPAQVVAGNERVIRPRLADAQFFFDSDRQQKLESRRERLKEIVFQEKLGTLDDKSGRVEKLAGDIGEQIGANLNHCQRAAELAKCDLTTAMVNEFAELQGIMGAYYARHDGEPEAVANAIREHYLPRFAGDQIAASPVGAALAIADKLDTICGLFAIGRPPTGSKDPFALRRAAIGILRTLIEGEYPLDIMVASEQAARGFGKLAGRPDDLVDQLYAFFMERLRAWYLEEGVAAEVIAAVLAVEPRQPLDFDHRVRAVREFSALPEAAALAAANKRVANILDSAGAGEIGPALDHTTLPAGSFGGASDDGVDPVDMSLLKDDAEFELHAALETALAQSSSLFKRGDRRGYTEGLTALAVLRPAVDRFFDEVLVMCEDADLRRNRLTLLRRLRTAFLWVADISLMHQPR